MCGRNGVHAMCMHAHMQVIACADLGRAPRLRVEGADKHPHGADAVEDRGMTHNQDANCHDAHARTASR